MISIRSTFTVIMDASVLLLITPPDISPYLNNSHHKQVINNNIELEEDNPDNAEIRNVEFKSNRYSSLFIQTICCKSQWIE